MSFTCRALWRIHSASGCKVIADNHQLLMRYFNMMEDDCQIMFHAMCVSRQRGKSDDERPTRLNQGGGCANLKLAKSHSVTIIVLYHKVVMLALRLRKRGPA